MKFTEKRKKSTLDMVALKLWDHFTVEGSEVNSLRVRASIQGKKLGMKFKVMKYKDSYICMRVG